MRSTTQLLAKLPDTKLSFPGVRLLIRSRHVISSKRVGFRVNPMRFPTQDRCLTRRIQISISRLVRILTTTTNLLIQYGEFNDFQSLFVLTARVSHLSSGICDILITGKVSYVVAVHMFRPPIFGQTGERYGDAWGHFTIHGRVRPWDGLVVLLRFPVRIYCVRMHKPTDIYIIVRVW